MCNHGALFPELCIDHVTDRRVKGGENAVGERG